MNPQKVRKPRLPQIGKWEVKLLDLVNKRLLLIVLICVSALALVIRFMLRDNIAVDAQDYLLPWYDTIKSNGGLESLSHQVGNYNILYQFFIALFTYIPIKPLYSYKLFSVIFDFLLAGLAMRIVMKNETSCRELKGVLIYSVILLSPIVFLNSAYWAQCDVIYTYFCVFSVYEMVRDRYLPSMLLFGAAITFKLQAIFILPFLLFCYLYKKRFSILYFLSVPAVMIALSLPGIIMGRGFFEVFGIYLDQSSTYPLMTLHYPSFWSLFIVDESSLYGFYMKFHVVGVLLTIAVLGILMIVWIQKKIPLTLKNAFTMAFIISYTCVLLLPAMHERYGFVYEILALFLAVWYVRTIPLTALMYYTTIATYSRYLFGLQPDFTHLAFINVAVYIAFVLYLHKQMFKDAGADDAPGLPDPVPVQIQAQE